MSDIIKEFRENAKVVTVCKDRLCADTAHLRHEANETDHNLIHRGLQVLNQRGGGTLYLHGKSFNVGAGFTLPPYCGISGGNYHSNGLFPIIERQIMSDTTPIVTIDTPGEFAYVDAGDIRITVIKTNYTEIRSYGLDGDIENAKNYAAALAEAIRIAEEWG